MNPHFKPVALAHASRLINHGPTVLVTSAHRSARNIMAAAWSMPVEFTPPRIAIVIDKGTYTRELIQASGVFGVCIPGTALAKLTYAVGSESGRTVDKLAKHGLALRLGPVLGVPLLEEGCAAWLECRLIPNPTPRTRTTPASPRLSPLRPMNAFFRRGVGISQAITKP